VKIIKGIFRVNNSLNYQWINNTASMILLVQAMHHFWKLDHFQLVENSLESKPDVSVLSPLMILDAAILCLSGQGEWLENRLN
jgi:hypothetical protein